jgi:hypothetical protein
MCRQLSSLPHLCPLLLSVVLPDCLWHRRRHDFTSLHQPSNDAVSLGPFSKLKRSPFLLQIRHELPWPGPDAVETETHAALATSFSFNK